MIINLYRCGVVAHRVVWRFRSRVYMRPKSNSSSYERRVDASLLIVSIKFWSRPVQHIIIKLSSNRYAIVVRACCVMCQCDTVTTTLRVPFIFAVVNRCRPVSSLFVIVGSALSWRWDKRKVTITYQVSNAIQSISSN